MSLDDRLRGDLRRSVETVRFDEDTELEYVRMAHRRGRMRTRVMRQATTAAVVFSLFVGVGIFVSSLTTAHRYRSTATVSVAAPPNANATSTTDALPVKLSDPLALALAPATRRTALRASHLAQDDTSIDFRATSTASDVLSLTATGPTPSESTAVTRNWVAALGQARLNDVQQQLATDQKALNRRRVALHDRLIAVDTQLAKLDPARYGLAGRYDNPQPGASGPPDPNFSPSDQASVQELHLALERQQLIHELIDGASKVSAIQLAKTAPVVATKLIMQTPATTVDGKTPATATALTGWLVGLVIVLAGAVLAYRIRTRSIRQTLTSSR